MKNSFKIILSILAVAFVLSGCKKYEEGPGFSLLTKKSRITGLWELESITTKAGVTTFYKGKNILKINKNDSFLRQKENGALEEGTWAFTSEKESIILTYTKNGNPYVEELVIVRLKNNEFWVRNSGGDQLNYVTEIN